MRALLLAVPLLAATAAQAGDKTPPGLERVCASIQPEVTTTEVLATALESGPNNACDHPAYADGKCVISRKALAVTTTDAMSVALTEPLATDTESVDDPLYVASLYNLDPAADASTQSVTLWVEGKLLLDDVVLGEPPTVTGYVEWSETTKSLVHVVEAHGKTITFPAKADDTLKEDAVSLTSTVTGAGSSYYLVAENGGDDEKEKTSIEIDIVITFDESWSQ